jgi:hypothetical protein
MPTVTIKQLVPKKRAYTEDSDEEWNEKEDFNKKVDQTKAYGERNKRVAQKEFKIVAQEYEESSAEEEEQ